ncbi:MAG TPA: hypothetical protein VGD98_12330 [Ktedonobacteraceae bacterium]
MKRDNVNQQTETKDALAEAFQSYHALLFAIAYRMLGSASEALSMLARRGM